MLSVTLILVIITCAVSIPAFSNRRLIDDLIFYPPAITQRKQWYRFFSCGLIHADFLHLAFNMIALYSFGQNVESGLNYSTDNGIIRNNGFEQIFGPSQGKLMYALMYVAAIGFSLLPTYAKHKDDYHYRSLGASGAVSAVIFAGMLLEPRIGVGILFIPVFIPGYIFAPLFLIISHYLARKGHGNINHSAHLWGALFGMAFLLVNAYALTDYDIISQFVQSVRSHINI